MKPLVVDDHSLIREAVRHLVGALADGVTVFTAADGDEGFAIAEREPELALPDFNLRGLAAVPACADAERTPGVARTQNLGPCSGAAIDARRTARPPIAGAWWRVLETLVAYRLIDPGSAWRLHRQWFDASAMAVGGIEHGKPGVQSGSPKAAPGEAQRGALSAAHQPRGS